MIEKKYAYAALVCLYVAAMTLRLFFFFNGLAGETLPQYAGRQAVVEGRVAADPDRRATSLHITVADVSIDGRAARGTLLAYVPRDTVVAYGDHVVLKGSVSLPEAFETQSGRTFDYPTYLRVRGISVLMEHVELTAREDGGLSLRGVLFDFKHRFKAALERMLPEPSVSVLEGMLLGERGGITQDLLQLFVMVGFIHILVLSGTHIAIVSEGIFRTLSFLPRRALYVVGGAAIVLFAIGVSGGAAAARAVAMGSIALMARYFRRTSAALRSLAAAAALLVLWNPLIVLDPGFVLSFLATFGIITVAPAAERHMRLVPAWRAFNMRSIAATTLAAELAILPAVLYFSGVLSFVSFPINVMLLPIIPVVMYLGFVTGMLAMLHPALAFLPALAADLLLRLLVGAVTWAASLPFAAATVATFPAWAAVLIYLPMIAIALYAYRKATPGLTEGAQR